MKQCQLIFGDLLLFQLLIFATLNEIDAQDIFFYFLDLNGSILCLFTCLFFFLIRGFFVILPLIIILIQYWNITITSIMNHENRFTERVPYAKVIISFSLFISSSGSIKKQEKCVSTLWLIIHSPCCMQCQKKYLQISYSKWNYTLLLNN